VNAKDRAWLDRQFLHLECLLVLQSAAVREARADLAGLKASLVALRRKPGMKAEEILRTWAESAEKWNAVEQQQAELHGPAVLKILRQGRAGK
jgi:hypothetical protein